MALPVGTSVLTLERAFQFKNSTCCQGTNQWRLQLGHVHAQFGNAFFLEQHMGKCWNTALQQIRISRFGHAKDQNQMRHLVQTADLQP